MDVVAFYKKWIEPFFAVAVLIMVLILVGKIIESNNLQTEIKDNCGWEESEKIRCYCEKSLVDNWENEQKGLDVVLELVEGGLNG